MNVCTKTRKELADEYNVNIRTFMSWCKDVGVVLPRGLLYPKKVKEIYQKLGMPDNKR